MLTYNKLLQKISFIIGNIGAILCFMIFMVHLSKNNDLQLIGKLTAQIELILHVFLILLVIEIYNKSTLENKKIFIWFVITMVGLFFNDLIYYITVYYDDTLLMKLSLSAFWLTYSSYLIWIISASIFFLQTLYKYVIQNDKFIKIILLFIIIDLIVLGLFLPAMINTATVLSWQTYSIIVNFLFDLIICNFLILGLIYVENRAIFLITSGIIFIVSGDFFICNEFFFQTLLFSSYGELLWLLGLILLLYGMIALNKTDNYVIKNWFRRSNSVKSKLIIWSFILSVMSFLIFFIIAYQLSIINKNIFVYLPLFIMILSILIIFISLFFGKTFEISFKQFLVNIENLIMSNGNHQVSSFSIEEFAFLQQHFSKVLQLKDEKDKLNKRIGDISARVAHDLNNPINGVRMHYAKNTSNYPQ